MNEEEDINWIDPDVLAFDPDISVSGDPVSEMKFKEFFEIGWLDPDYDELRDRWDPLLDDEDPHGRLLAKTALWSLVKLLNQRRDRS